MEKLFLHLYKYFEKHRAVFVMCFTASFLLVAILASRIKFEEDISKILPKDKKIEKLNQVFQNSKFLDKLVLTVSLKDPTAEGQPDSLAAFAEILGTTIQQNLGAFISKVHYKVDDGVALELMSTVTEHIPLFLDSTDYKSIDSLLQPAALKTTLENNIRTLSSPAGVALKNIIARDPVGISFLGLKNCNSCNTMKISGCTMAISLLRTIST